MNGVIRLPSQKITAMLIVIVVMLTILSVSLGLAVAQESSDSPLLGQLLTLFNLDGEGNLPTWFQTMLLTVIGLTMLTISYYRYIMKQHKVLSWLILGFIFLILSVDEFVKLHEITIKPLRDTLDTSGALYFAWIIPATIIVAILGVIYLPFLIKLPKNTRKWLFIGGLIYFLGAVGMEAMGGMYLTSDIASQFDDPQASTMYVLIVNLEETFEMIGLVTLFHTSFAYLRLLLSKVKLEA